MIEKIYAHNIWYSWSDGKKRELSDCDREHIIKMLSDDYVEGELCQHDHDLDKEVYGWWRIDKNGN